jgi:hypothetical protein
MRGAGGGYRGIGTRLVLGCAALLLLLATPARADEPRLRAQLERASAAVGEQLRLSVTLEGFSQRAGEPQIPPVAGIEIYDAGRSTSISLVNGRLSSSTSYTFVVVPGSAGTFTLGPITVEDKGRAYTTEPLTLTVGAGGPAPAARAPGVSPSRSAESPAPAAAGQGLFARLETDKRDAYPGEQITLHFRLFQRDDIALTDLADFQPPATEGFWREDLGPQREYTTQIDGRTYRVREMSWALFATRAGDLQVGSASIVAYVAGRSRGRSPFDDFFGGSRLDRRPVPLQAEGWTVRVRPLPDEGRPEGFTGSVGDYRLEARFDVPQARRGEPFTLTAKVSGTGHVQAIGAPSWPDWKGLRVFDSGEAVSVDKGEDRIGGEKTFTQVLIASRAGKVRLDPVRFVFFDPARRRYQTVSTLPLEIQVVEGGAGVDAGGGEALPLAEDVLYIHTDIASELRPPSAGGASAAWAMLALPVVLVGGAALLRWRRATAESDPAFGRRSQAFRSARRALAGGPHGETAARTAARIAELLETYLSDWLDIPVRGTTRDELRGALQTWGLPDELVRRVGALLDRSEEMRFGAGGDAERAAELGRDAGRLVADLEASFRRPDRGGRR